MTFTLRALVRLLYRRTGLYCLVYRHHPVRVAIGGLRCASCGRVGADWSDMGFDDTGYVPALRRIFSRANGGELTTTTAWAPTKKRGW